MTRLRNDVCRVDLRKYLDPHKRYSAWYTRQPIWLDIHLGSALLFDDNEIAAAYRVLHEHGFAVTSAAKDGGWLLEWRETPADLRRWQAMPGHPAREGDGR